MKNSGNPLVLAIDGGGTRCRVAVSDGARTTLVETGAANISTDPDGTIREIRDGLGKLAQRLGLPIEALWDLPAFVGLAGITGVENANLLRAALPFRCLRVEDDRPAALRGALGARNGVIAHCGTGSFFAAQHDGRMRFSGGWGSVLGDEASAQWVGRYALRLTLEAVDGRLKPSALTERLLGDFGSSAKIVRFATTARPFDFGALAPLVTQFAAEGDLTAQRIMQSGADEIARALPHLGWLPDQTLCLTGGIGPHYVHYLPDALRAQVSPPAGEPLAGALLLARDLCEEREDERG